MTQPIIAESKSLTVDLMKDFFDEQFAVNETPGSMEHWQVYDRTTDTEIPASKWEYDRENHIVKIHDIIPFHTYTVSFLAYRIWEEISMYNHITNNWDKEHLMQIDPRYPEVQAFMKEWLENGVSPIHIQW